MKLTKMEQKVLFGLTERSDPKDVADLINSVANTVRSNIKRLLEKKLIKLNDMGRYILDVPALIEYISEPEHKEGSPDVRAFMKWWSWAFTKKYQATYAWAYTTEVPMVKRLVSLYDIDTVKYKAMMYFKEETRPSLGQFNYKINQFNPTQAFKEKAKDYLEGEG